MGGGAVMANGIPRRDKGGAGRGGAVSRRGGAVGKKKMIGGAQVSAAEREKALQTECAKSRRKRISQNTPEARAGRAAKKPVGRGVERWLGPAGRPRPVGVGWAG